MTSPEATDNDKQLSWFGSNHSRNLRVKHSVLVLRLSLWHELSEAFLNISCIICIYKYLIFFNTIFIGLNLIYQNIWFYRLLRQKSDNLWKIAVFVNDTIGLYGNQWYQKKSTRMCSFYYWCRWTNVRALCTAHRKRPARKFAVYLAPNISGATIPDFRPRLVVNGSLRKALISLLAGRLGLCS